VSPHLISRRELAVVLAALALIPLTALMLAAWAVIDGHNQSARQRKEARDAIVLVANANCAENNVLRRAALATARTPGAIDRIEQFFRDFNMPLNKALTTLGAKPCTGGSP